MKLKYSTLLFDLDGTLTDSGEGIIRCVQYALEHFGIVENDMEKLNTFIGPPLLHSFNRWYPQFTGEDLQEALRLYRVRYNDIGMFENRVYDGIYQLLDDLKAAGYRLFVATAKPEMFTFPILEHFELDKRFDKVYGCVEEIGRLDKADVIRHIVSENPDIDRENTIMIGDRNHDVLGAADNGLDCIGVLYGFGDRPELEKAGAKYIAETVEDLRKLLL